jgi:MFS family permease
MDILIESLSKNNSTGRTRAIYFTFINAGWIFSPLISSYLITKGGYSLIFLASAILILPVLAVFNQQSQHAQPDIKYDRKALWPVITRMCKDKNRRSIFIISMLLQLFYSSAVIYIPFYLLNTLGMDYKVLGPIFSLMLLPFLIIEIPAGIMADKYWGEKEMLIAGLLIISGSLFFFYYINTPTIWLWALVLFFSRIGAALVEAMRESYFFKIVDAKDLIDINLFRTAGPMGYIIASALAIIILRFFPLNYLFLFLSIVMLAGLTFAMTLRDTK